MDTGPRILLAVAALTLTAQTQTPPVSFEPLAPEFAEAAAEYAAIWQAEGPEIVAALEAHSGLPFPDEPLEALVRRGPPMTSLDGRTMRLSASYSSRYKRATLVHEMGHRLLAGLPRPAGLDDHRLLYLFLYDVWVDLYGRDFADRMVWVERQIPGPYDYDAAWTWALAMTQEERQALLRSLNPRLNYRPMEVAG